VTCANAKSDECEGDALSDTLKLTKSGLWF